MAVDYEIAILLSSQLPEGQAEAAIDRYQKVMTDGGAEVVKVDRWGVRKLAYEIRKQQQADYTFVRFTGEPSVVDELDRLCKLDEGVLRHMIIRPEGGFEPEPEPEEETPEASEEGAEDEGAQEEESGDESEDESEDDDAETEEDSE